jgi:hypothetical protein
MGAVKRRLSKLSLHGPFSLGPCRSTFCLLMSDLRGLRPRPMTIDNVCDVVCYDGVVRSWNAVRCVVFCVGYGVVFECGGVFCVEVYCVVLHLSDLFLSYIQLRHLLWCRGLECGGMCLC